MWPRGERGRIYAKEIIGGQADNVGLVGYGYCIGFFHN